MPVTRMHSLLALVPVLVAIGCRSASGNRTAPGDKVYTAHVITSEAIERSGATDAWEIIKKLSTMARAKEAYDGEPERLEPRRGHGSIVLRDDPMVYVDGIPLTDLRSLRQIGAHEVDSIEEMGSIEATAYFGTNSNAGVILIHSRSKAAN
jgi:TonB-dependent receptor-like protein